MPSLSAAYSGGGGNRPAAFPAVAASTPVSRCGCDQSVPSIGGDGRGTGLLAGVAVAARSGPREVEQDRAEVDAAFSNATSFLSPSRFQGRNQFLRRDPRQYVAATVREREKVYQDVALHLKGISAASGRWTTNQASR